MFLVLVDLAVLALGPQLLFLRDQCLDACEGVLVLLCHESSLPDRGARAPVKPPTPLHQPVVAGRRAGQSQQ